MGNPSHEASDQEISHLAQRLLPVLVAGLFLLFVLPPVGVVFLLLGIGIALTGGGDDEGDHALGRRPT